MTFIFLILGIIHFNWVIGGQFGFVQAIPTKENGERVLNPKKMDSAIVGAGLLVFSFFYLILANLISFDLPHWFLKYGIWIIPSIFLLRAIGDFKYIGFFKRIRQTEFGKWDTKLFSPLCLVIALIGFVLAF